MKPFWEVADFVRRLRREMRFGELSRAPLRLLRLELSGESLACDWLARHGDIWDQSLKPHQREHNESEQALRDAVRVRDLVLDSLPQVEIATLRAFRSLSAREPPELIIAGSMRRDDPGMHQRASLVMQAKLSGFRFYLREGRLESMPFEEFEMSFGRSATPEYALK